ncbi:hypothetical protein HG536_0A06560 [Torulaspora globosa]|uniref:Protein HIR n=1 Tax=Torulaspora globosa TaxID=48254 RepID=A0A7G3ZBF5_9SACH|nr:uncharacterized protein HG536_0A06560 [Torulaspora globosa]QLL30841.1 hypothetical protein HG536_0A06560 [Torulaspora globosa]
MKLLKYPLGEHNKTVTALASAGSRLVLADERGHVHVWSQQRLAEAAFDGSKIQQLGVDSTFAVRYGPGQVDRSVVFMVGDERELFLGTEHWVARVGSWLQGSDMRWETVFECGSACTITDVKLERSGGVLFVLTSGPNGVNLFDSRSLRLLGRIALDSEVKPITGIVDPVGQIFTVLASDRSVLVYQYSATGAFKQLQRLAQCVKVDPVRYKISMPPQGDVLPVVNAVKGSGGSSSASILLLDRNDNFQVAATLVAPPANECVALKFSPKVYVKCNAKKGTKSNYNLLATSGSTQNSVVVWNTKRVKPLFGAIQLSQSPIVDMVWSEDGLKLFAISGDNVLYTFAFQPDDLGETLAPGEVELLQRNNKSLPPLADPVIADDSATKVSIKTEGENLWPQQKSDVAKSNGKKSGKKKQPAQVMKKTQGTTMEFSGPSYAVPKDLKIRPKNDAAKGMNGVKKQKKDLDPIDFLDTSLILPLVAFSKVRLATPKVRLSFNYKPAQNQSLTLEVKNGSGNEQKPSIVRLVSKEEEGEKVLFQDLIPKFITICTSGNNFWALCTNDGFLYVYSDTGKRILPPLCLGMSCSFLEACASYLLCLTSIGQLYCWDIEKKKLHFPVNTIFPLLNPSLRYSDDILTRAENITICAVTENGVPLVTLSNGDGYMFDKDLETWLLISDGWWAYGSQYWDMTNTNNLQGSICPGEKRDSLWNSGNGHQLASTVREDKKSIINFVERKTNDELNRKGRIKNLQRFARTILMKEGFENMEEIVTLSHLENRLLVTLRLQENSEFSKTLVIYCIRLSELGYTDRLDDVLSWLYNAGDYEKSMLAGKSRKEHLKDVLIACADQRHVQRITSGYASALGLLDNIL